MGLVTMTQRELSRVQVLNDLVSGRTTIAATAQLLGISRRQVFRLRDRFEKDGAAGLASRNRGKPSNHKLPDDLRRQVLDIVRERYEDFGPTLASEKLKALHGIAISPETLRIWMKAEGIWMDRRNQKKPVYQPRYRRERMALEPFHNERTA